MSGSPYDRDPPTEAPSVAEALEIAERGFDNIARLAAMNVEEVGWGTEVHRIACECWRQVKDARRFGGREHT